jgi:beta-N-acetylhexosaminidase
MDLSNHRGAIARRWLLAAILTLVLGIATACGSHGGPSAGPSPSVGPPTASPTGPISPTPPASPGQSAEDACVTATMNNLTLPQRVGQVMMVGTSIGTPSDVNSLIQKYSLGGVFLAGRSHQPASQLSAAIAALQATAKPGIGLLVALDQEGGEVQTLQGADFPPIPTAVTQGGLSQATLHTQTVEWTRRLAGVGVTLDLAPVADTVPTSIGTGNPPIGAFFREYGSDPTAVAADIDTVVTAMQSTGVVSTLKHFPGLGRVRSNTDTSTAAVDSVATSHDPYLAPFAAGIRAGTGAVMISSASYPNLDPQSIAPFSHSIVTTLLRQQLGFSGVIISDDLGAAVAASAVPVSQRAVRFIQAGGDITLSVSASAAATMIDGLLAGVAASPTLAAQVSTAAGYVIRGKYAAGLLACSPAKKS